MKKSRKLRCRKAVNGEGTGEYYGEEEKRRKGEKETAEWQNGGMAKRRNGERKLN
jgi:hypothetical protein